MPRRAWLPLPPRGTARATGCFVRISKTRYMSATPRSPCWPADLKRTSKGAGMKRSDWTIALAVGLCAIGLVACGGGGSSSGGGDGAAGEEGRLAFAECMRAHGVEMEDPKAGQNIDLGGDNDPTTKKALAACDDKLSGGQELTSEE